MTSDYKPTLSVVPAADADASPLEETKVVPESLIGLWDLSISNWTLKGWERGDGHQRGEAFLIFSLNEGLRDGPARCASIPCSMDDVRRLFAEVDGAVDRHFDLTITLSSS